ncbi:MAG: type II toxin-antitoxin system VapC family toxin [Mycobacterium sp.]
MILVDTSVWVDHLHRTDRRLVEFLEEDEVWQHPHVIEELALGSVRGRTEFLALLSSLRSFPVLTHAELMILVEAKRLWGRGLSAVDAHLIGSVALTPGAVLWTRDKRLAAVASELNVSSVTGGR